MELSRRSRRARGRLLTGLLLVGAVACSSSTPVTVPVDGTLPVGTLPPVTALPATTTALAAATSTAAPITSTSSAPVATLPCTPTDGVLTTATGRHVLVRANGVAPGSPLVLILHGYTGTPTGIEHYAEFTAMANAASVVVAYPEGTPVQGFEGFGWATGSSIFSTEGVDDAAALVEMIDAVLATGCVDPARITIAGESNGAAMSLVAVCDARLRDRVASLVMVIPAVDDGVLAHCAAGGRPLPMTVVAGRLDRTAPYDGGRATLLPQEDWFQRAAALVNGCADAGSRAALTDQVARVEPGGCGACSVFLAIADGTHTWPGSSDGVADLRPGTFDLSVRLLQSALGGTPGCLA
ncbi:MAG: PHB depolymerase family esterase [Ilumatobacteraceae bacterium]